jgi:dienelactone hydrolase
MQLREREQQFELHCFVKIYRFNLGLFIREPDLVLPIRSNIRLRMFTYFENNYTWSSAVNLVLMAGGDLGQIDRFLRPLKSQPATAEAWLQAWTSIAKHQENLAEKDSSRQFRESAAARYIRAALYHLAGERQISPSPSKRESYDVALIAFRVGAALLSPPLERVEIPSADGILPGWIIPARNTTGPAPIIVFYNGFDSTKETLYGIIRNTFADLGISCLVIDTPGNGEPLRLRNVASRSDYEVPTKAIVDFLETREDLDPARIGLLGISLGGYYAPRGASFEPRIKAVVSWGAVWDYGRLWRHRWETKTDRTGVPFWQLAWVMGSDDMETALQLTESFKLKEALPHLKQPLLILHGESDPITLEDARAALSAAGTEDKELRLFMDEEGGSEHVGADDPDPSRRFIADWFVQKLLH